MYITSGVVPYFDLYLSTPLNLNNAHAFPGADVEPSLARSLNKRWRRVCKQAGERASERASREGSSESSEPDVDQRDKTHPSYLQGRNVASLPAIAPS